MAVTVWAARRFSIRGCVPRVCGFPAAGTASGTEVAEAVRT